MESLDRRANEGSSPSSACPRSPPPSGRSERRRCRGSWPGSRERSTPAEDAETHRAGFKSVFLFKPRSVRAVWLYLITRLLNEDIVARGDPATAETYVKHPLFSCDADLISTLLRPYAGRSDGSRAAEASGAYRRAPFAAINISARSTWSQR